MSLFAKTNLKLEILLATMNRNSLDFLVDLFPQGNYLDYNILVVNQTTEANILESTEENIRVINSFEKGLSKSRNLAINNALGSICLLADDDVKYNNDFHDIIVDSFETQKEADIITYKMKNFEGDDFRTYNKRKKHRLSNLNTVNAVVIAFRKNSIRDNNMLFNIHFGLGSTFKTADEYIFLRDCFGAKLNIQFCNEYILSHNAISSGQDSGSDTIVFARAALFHKYSGFFSYLKLYKYLYFLVRKKYISWSQFIPKLKVGLKGITTYKQLLKKEETPNE